MSNVMVTVFVVHTYVPGRKGTQSRWFLTTVAAESFAHGKRCFGTAAKVERREVSEADAAKYAGYSAIDTAAVRLKAASARLAAARVTAATFAVVVEPVDEAEMAAAQAAYDAARTAYTVAARAA